MMMKTGRFVGRRRRRLKNLADVDASVHEQSGGKPPHSRKACPIVFFRSTLPATAEFRFKAASEPAICPLPRFPLSIEKLIDAGRFGFYTPRDMIQRKWFHDERVPASLVRTMMALPLLCMLCAANALPGEEEYHEGRAAERAGRPADAVRSYETCAGEEGPLRGYAHVRAAVCRARGGDAAGGMKSLGQSMALDGAGPWVRLAQYELALLLVNANRRQEASTCFVNALDGHPGLWWLDNPRWTAADNFITQDETLDQGYAFFRDIAENTPWRAPRLDAAARLAKSPRARDRSAAAFGFLRSGEYRDAVRTVEGLTGLVEREPEIAPEWRLLAARTAIVQGQVESGVSQIHALVNEDPKRALAPGALLYAVRDLLVIKKFAEAEAEAALLARDYAAADENGEAQWRLAEACVKYGRTGDGIERYARLADTLPAHPRADDAWNQIARTQRQEGRRAEALAASDKLIERFPRSEFVPEAAYWAGDMLVEIKSGDEAANRFEMAARAGLATYHGHRARERLVSLRNESTPRDLHAAGQSSFVRPIETPGAEVPPRDALGAFDGDERFQRLVFFGMHGFPEAEWEALHIADAMGDAPDPAAAYLALGETGVAYTAMQLAAETHWGEGEDGAPSLDRLRVQYPRAYWNFVGPLAREIGVDPFLVLAVARQESTYRPALTSHAGASGVMQLMPRTATWLANTEDSIEPEHAEDLEHPVNSFRLGATYLKRMIDRSGGNLVFALASYNGGPGNCDKWRAKNSTGDMAAFIESIPLDETRDYVKRVLGYYAAYHSVYPPAE